MHTYLHIRTYTIDIILKVCTDNFPYWLHYLQARYVSRLKFLARATETIADTPIKPILYMHIYAKYFVNFPISECVCMYVYDIRM